MGVEEARGTPWCSGKHVELVAESIELCCCFLEFLFRCGDSSDIRIVLTQNGSFCLRLLSHIYNCQRGIYTRTKNKKENKTKRSKSLLRRYLPTPQILPHIKLRHLVLIRHRPTPQPFRLRIIEDLLLDTPSSPPIPIPIAHISNR